MVSDSILKHLRELSHEIRGRPPSLMFTAMLHLAIVQGKSEESSALCIPCVPFAELDVGSEIPHVGVSELTPLSFYRDYVARNKPVIITGMHTSLLITSPSQLRTPHNAACAPLRPGSACALVMKGRWIAGQPWKTGTMSIWLNAWGLHRLASISVPAHHFPIGQQIVDERTICWACHADLLKQPCRES